METKLKQAIDSLVELALNEDIGSGDCTTSALIDPAFQSGAVLLAKSPLVFCGHDVAKTVFERIDSTLGYEAKAGEGKLVTSGDVIAVVKGSFASILTAERTVLNFVQRLSGVATMTARYVGLVKDTGVSILDTRKTTPGWRLLEKYAVKTGGGKNHRIGLFDAVLIKNNHIDSWGQGVASAITRCRESVSTRMKIQVEVRSIDELREALEVGCDAILLDNMTPQQCRESVELVRGEDRFMGIELEASGGITEESVRAYAETGVNSISVGALTHSAPAVDISLRYDSKV